jgi:hypothetical protein
MRYELFDGRYTYNKDRALCLYSCHDLDDAINSINDFGPDTCLVQIDDEGNELLLYALWGIYADIEIVRAAIMLLMSKESDPAKQ